jgi:NADP-dependent 3-hydroxy acid dehydrogenase YdfG
MAKTPRSLTGKVAVVTGGGRGIGAATARALAAQGARVAIGDLDVTTAEATAASIGGVGLHLDVTDRPGYTAFLDEVERRLGPIDILVNNAGIMPVVRADEEADATIIRQIEINLHGVIHGTAEAMRRMKPRGTGHIVNIASAAGKNGFPGLATYCATKHGVVGYSEAVRGELRGTGVEVSVVMPSFVSTELASGIKDARGVKRVTPEAVADALVRAVQFPKFDVFVPRETGALVKLTAILPRGLREGVARALKADRLMLDAIGSSERAAYEARAAASAPAAEEVVETSAA